MTTVDLDALLTRDVVYVQGDDFALELEEDASARCQVPSRPLLPPQHKLQGKLTLHLTHTHTHSLSFSLVPLHIVIMMRPLGIGLVRGYRIGEVHTTSSSKYASIRQRRRVSSKQLP